MAKTRVHDLAKEFGITSKEMLEHLSDMKIPAKSASSSDPTSAPSPNSPPSKSARSKAASDPRASKPGKASWSLACSCLLARSIRSSSRPSSPLPGRSMAPAWNTRSPTLKPLTSRPMARTVPTASQPRMRQLPAAGRADARTFVSAGLTAMASTATSRSFGPGSGSGSSMSTSERSSEMGRGWLKPMAFMVISLQKVLVCQQC